MTVWREVRDAAVLRLQGGGVDDPAQEVRWMVEQASGRTAAEQVASLDAPVTEREAAAMERMVGRRCAGEPLQHVLGHWGFRTLDLMVDARVLIPRPETEVVAGIAIEALAELNRHAPRGSAATEDDARGPDAKPTPAPDREEAGGAPSPARRAAASDRVERPREGRAPVAVDLGTGSGAIALSIAAELWPHVEVWATDASPDALAVARANLAGLGRRAGVVRLVEGDWFDALPPELRGHVDLVVSNPPYVGASERLPEEVSRWEPATALISGPTGLEAIERIVGEAGEWLTGAGALVVEIGETQGPAVAALARAAGFTDVTIHPDLTGRDRAVVAHR